MVSAWCSAQKFVLGQTKVNEGSNEITTAPELIDLLQIKGAIITMDAMGCRLEIARKVLDKKMPETRQVRAKHCSIGLGLNLHFNNSLTFVIAVFPVISCGLES